jgi:hypothetical protein
MDSSDNTLPESSEQIVLPALSQALIPVCYYQLKMVSNALLLLWMFQNTVSVTPLSFEATPFRSAFNEQKGLPRLIGVFSPTCAHCLQTCSEIQAILEEHSDAEIQVYLLWSPFETGDNLGQVFRAAGAYLYDPRVKHYWDIWRYGARSLSPVLRVPVEQAWDMVVFYEPGKVWEDGPPDPDFWMQNRNLLVGTPYSRKGLERKLRKWF